jgi:hypothetical protein
MKSKYKIFQSGSFLNNQIIGNTSTNGCDISEMMLLSSHDDECLIGTGSKENIE